MKTLAIAFVLAVAATAHADPMSSEARAYFDRGTADYETGDYAAAITELQAGRRIDPHPGFLYALGQAYRKQGDCTHAVAHYLAFLDTHPPQSTRRFVRANITRCAASATTTTTRATEPPPPPTEQPQIEPPPVVDAPPPAVVPPRLPPPAPRPPDAQAARHFYDDVPGDLLAAGGLVGLGVGMTYLVLGEGDARAANSAPSLVKLQQLASQSSRERAIGEVGAIAGGALGVAAIVRYVIVARRAPVPLVSIAVGPSGVAAVWSGRF